MFGRFLKIQSHEMPKPRIKLSQDRHLRATERCEDMSCWREVSTLISVLTGDFSLIKVLAEHNLYSKT